MSLSYPLWIEDLVRKTGNYTLYEAYEILNEVLEEKVYSLKELGWEGEDSEKRFSKEELILYLLTNSNFYVFI